MIPPMTPLSQPSETPTLDLLTYYAGNCRAVALAGAVTWHDRYADFATGKTSQQPSHCHCGAAVDPVDWYVQLANSYGSILPPLGLHFLVWHRSELPAPVLGRIQLAAQDTTTALVRAWAPESPETQQSRSVLSRQSAVALLAAAREQVVSWPKLEHLTGIISASLGEMPLRQLGWALVYPDRQLAEALFAQVYPDEGTHWPTEYMAERIGAWTESGIPLVAVLAAIDAAMSALQSDQ